MLAYLDFNRLFLLYIDALKEELEAILVQEELNQKIYPVTFISYKNNKYECNYLITDLKELVIF